MQIWPAIDLRGGKCVRLQQGDYARETIFGEDPAAMARHWAEQGGEYLHLVDLDGAKAGRIVNWDSIRAIVAAVKIPCEIGGGIRSEETINELLDLGISRLVIGTLALKQPQWFRQMCRQYPDRLVLGMDARDGMVATDGWLETSSMPARELVLQFDQEPVAAVIYTDISTDGMLSGPSIGPLRELCAATRIPVIASGGVASADDITRLREIPVAGCIIGRALYEHTLTLPEALERARR